MQLNRNNLAILHQTLQNIRPVILNQKAYHHTLWKGKVEGNPTETVREYSRLFFSKKSVRSSILL
jgi:hypothetical protein